MLKLIEGGFFAGGHERCIKAIEAATLAGRHVLLIVPEQQTLSCEREMCDILPPSAALTFEVTNFTRLADTVFRSLGGIAGRCADKTKKALIMWRALTALLPELKTLGGKEISTGSISKMLAAIKQMQASGLTADELSAARDALEAEGAGADRRLLSKLSDISKVMPLYKELLTKEYTDADDAVLLANAKLKETSCAFLEGYEIYIDGFTSFTAPQLDIIDTLIRSSIDVTVNLALPRAGADAFEYTELRRTHTKLLGIAAKAGLDVKLERTEGRGNTAPIITEVADLLWRSGCAADKESLTDKDAFRIFEAEDPHEECDFVAQDIKRRVMNGARYSDFGVLARSMDGYIGIIDVAFEKAEVPLFISARTDVSSFEAVKLIYSAIEAAIGGFVRRDVISYSKCSLCGVERALADEFELYVEKWQIDGARFTDGIAWNMNPAGYTTSWDKRAEEKLLRINAAREAIISPLETLADGMRDASTVKEYATALVEFLTSLDIESALAKKADEGNTYGGLIQSGVIDKLWRMICDALDSLCEVLGDVKVTADVFFSLLKIAFAEADIGTLPAFAEEVSAGSADVARMYGKKHIYIIGLNRGAFPLAVDDDGYFSDKDKVALCDVGLGIEADTDARSATELYYLSRAIAYAQRSVTLTYPAVDSSFKPAPPSEAIGRIGALTGGRIKPVKLSTLSAWERIYSREYALEHLCAEAHDHSALRSALCEVGDESRILISEAEIKNSNLKLTDAATSLLYTDKLRMSQSKLEKYIGCPMSYFCSYNLGLKDEERVEFDNRNIGIFVHSILENFFAELKKRGRMISTITEDEKRELVRTVATKYVTSVFEGVGELPTRLKVTIDNLCRFSMPVIDSLCDEFADCAYEPMFFELKIDRDAPGSPEPSVFKTEDGRDIYFSGVVDRVDTYRSGDDVYVRVIDYKTGSKEFRPDDIGEGRNLQMFLYLKAIVESEKESFRHAAQVPDGGSMIPAGVIYVKANVTGGKIARNDAAEARDAAKKTQAREGMLLDDKASIGAMNGRFIPVKFKSNGDPDAHSAAKLYTPLGWEQINQTIERIVSDECTRMVFGDICAKPMREKRGKSSVCKWCEFKPICRNANAPRDSEN